MILRVGPFHYRVHFVEGDLLHEGERCLGLCDNETHDIYIDARLGFAQQVHVICHEYMEAWLYQFGPPTPHQPLTKETYCDIFGMAMAQFVMDLIHRCDHLAGGSPTTDAPAATAPTTFTAPAPATDANRERIATKLAQAAQRAGLRVRDMPEAD